jgi:hypothetical protein
LVFETLGVELPQLLTKLWVALGLTCLTTTSVYAQSQEDGRYWMNLNLQGKVYGDNFYWNMDIHPRWREGVSHFDTLIMRPSVFYKFTPKTSVWIGYDTITFHPDGQESYQENRLWEQWMYQFDPIGRVNITSRSRLEQRDREDYRDIAHRWRQMFRFTAPSGFNQKLSWVVYDELFINLNTNSWISRRGIDQNRLFLGGNWKFDDNVNAEIGYLNQQVNGKTFDQENHVFSTTLRFNF